MYDYIKPWFNSKEAASYIGVSKGALRNMIYRGDIPVYKLGKRCRFSKMELDELLSGSRYRNGQLEERDNGNKDDSERKV